MITQLYGISVVLAPNDRRLEEKRHDLSKRMTIGNNTFQDTLDKLEDELVGSISATRMSAYKSNLV